MCQSASFLAKNAEVLSLEPNMLKCSFGSQNSQMSCWEPKHAQVPSFLPNTLAHLLESQTCLSALFRSITQRKCLFQSQNLPKCPLGTLNVLKCTFGSQNSQTSFWEPKLIKMSPCELKHAKLPRWGPDYLSALLAAKTCA